MNEVAVSDELIIDETNFSEYFRDPSKFSPRHGDILVRYRAKADFISGDDKKDVIYQLCNSSFGAKSAIQIIKKLGKTNEKEALSVAKRICEDLYGGMKDEEVLAKPYSYVLEMFFFANKDHIPKDDKHWDCITINNLEDFLKQKGS